MGFADNVFDQKRGRREERHSNGGNGRMLPGVSSVLGRKRPLAASAGTPSTPMRKIELPTPEPDYSASMSRKFAREGSDLYVDSSYANSVNGSMSRALPGVKSIEGSKYMISPPDDRSTSRISMSPGLGMTPASTLSMNPNTLPPILASPHQSFYHSTSNSHLGQLTSPTHPTSTPSISPSTTATNSLPLLPSMNPNSNGVPGLHQSSHTASASNLSPLDQSILSLESEITKLRQYEDEFIALGLDDSRKLLQRKVAELEGRMIERRRERGLLLVERLRREGLNELAGSVGREVGVGVEGGGEGRSMVTLA
jgi:hypothetical protein